MRQKGTLHGVGVGPGDTELLTLKAARLLREVRTISYPMPNGAESLARRIVSPLLSDEAVEIAIVLPMDTSGEAAAKAYDDAAQRIALSLDEGEDVLFLCEGDPLFYGSFVYLAQRLSSLYPIAVIPGITSVSACAAALGRPLAQRNEVVKIVPALLSEERLREELGDVEVAAIIKVGKSFNKVRRVLRELGLSHRASLVERATQPTQRIVPLAECGDGEHPYFSTILVLGERSS